MKKLFKKDKQALPIDNKMVESVDNKTANVGDNSNAVSDLSTNPNENAIQQKQLSALAKKPKLSYGEILEARRQAKKAKTLSGGNKGIEGE